MTLAMLKEQSPTMVRNSVSTITLIPPQSCIPHWYIEIAQGETSQGYCHECPKHCKRIFNNTIPQFTNRTFTLHNDNRMSNFEKRLKLNDYDLIEYK